MWAPHVISSACSSGLRDWVNKRKTSVLLEYQMVWREPKNHYDDCYFCIVNTTGFSMKNKHKIIFPDLQSARRPVPHDVSLPVPTPTLYGFNSLSDDVDTLSYSMDESSIGSEYVPEDSNLAPQTFRECELNDLAGILICRRKRQNFFHQGFNKRIYSTRML
ncbi:hypothetical protein LOD99_1573 [Oopsacas minuta]|uniref:Uncharacterized protein n=1 Tax=Oopsacas minuta TaxID=111878 RepID=A0AAV7K5X5_9METZ|nr:hypothetical protein LOD99_1573 [Oopsacas minuta]